MTSTTDERACLTGILALAVSAAGCAYDFNTPSAYQGQEYLCDAAHADAMAKLSNDCAADGHCAGALSLRGSLQGDPLTVGTTLTRAEELVVANGAAGQLWDQVVLNGASPYFDFVFYLKSIGGTVDDNPTLERTLQLHAVAPAQPNALADDLVQAGLLMEVAGASADLRAVTGSGAVVLARLSTSEIVGSLHGAFGNPSDVVDGCFDMFPTQITVTPTPGQ